MVVEKTRLGHNSEFPTSAYSVQLGEKQEPAGDLRGGSCIQYVRSAARRQLKLSITHVLVCINLFLKFKINLINF